MIKELRFFAIKGSNRISLLFLKVAIIAGNFELAEIIKNHKDTDIGKFTEPQLRELEQCQKCLISMHQVQHVYIYIVCILADAFIQCIQVMHLFITTACANPRSH